MISGQHRRATGPGVDDAVAVFLSSMSWIMGSADHLVIGRGAPRAGRRACLWPAPLRPALTSYRKCYLFESPVMAGFVCAACAAFMPGSNWRTCARWPAMLSFCLVRSSTSRWAGPWWARPQGPSADRCGRSQGRGGRCGCGVIGCGGRRVGPALVQAERRVGVGHQGGVGDDPQHPAVHADDEVDRALAGSGPRTAA